MCEESGKSPTLPNHGRLHRYWNLACGYGFGVGKFVCFSGWIGLALISGLNPLIAESRQLGSGNDVGRLSPAVTESKVEVVVAKLQEPSNDFALPADPSTIVLSLEYGGGLPMPQQKEFKPTPYVRIQADGKVITGGSSARATVAEMQLTQAELQQLLSSIIAEDKLLEIRQGEIDEAIKATGERIMVADAPTTTLTVKLADKEVRLRQYASRMVKSQFPQVESLQRFVRSENRLQHLHSVALLGGNDAMREILAAVNEAIGAKSADLPTMDPDCLQSVQRDPAGKLFATWERAGKIAGEEKRFTVWVEVDQKGQRKIEISQPRDRNP